MNIKKIAIVLLYLLVLLAIGLMPKQAHNEILTSEEITTIEDENKEEEKDEADAALDAWLDKLAEYECTNCPENFRHLDVNQRYSYSCLQFQEATFLEQGTRYGVIPAGIDAITAGIYDCDIQKAVARAMVKDQGAKAAGHWYHSVYTRGLGTPPGY
jgi:hypothetical protein